MSLVLDALTVALVAEWAILLGLRYTLGGAAHLLLAAAVALFLINHRYRGI